ncbi:MAG: hypothetical protein K6G79_07485 [Bacteroidales bacterium]|nr:hypothetical protein [Bacteroidales bacterium]
MKLRVLFAIIISAVLLSSCGTAQILYNWGGEYDGVTEYERLAYRSSDTQTPESLCSMLVLYQRLVSEPGGLRQVPPPGICAEYAWLLAQPETATTFAEHASSSQKARLGFSTADFLARSRELFEMEMKYYPESVKFIKPLAERLFK